MQKVWVSSIKSIFRCPLFLPFFLFMFCAFFHFCLCKAVRLCFLLLHVPYCALEGWSVGCICRMKVVMLLYTSISMYIPNWIEIPLFPFSSILVNEEGKNIVYSQTFYIQLKLAWYRWKRKKKTRYVCTIHINGEKICSIHRHCVHPQSTMMKQLK